MHPLDALRGVQQEDPRDPMLQSFDVAGGCLEPLETSTFYFLRVSIVGSNMW